MTKIAFHMYKFDIVCVTSVSINAHILIMISVINPEEFTQVSDEFGHSRKC